MEYAVIRYSNNQYLVKPGECITVLGEAGKVGDKLTAQTLLVKDGDLKIGEPEVGTISLTVKEITKTAKIDIFKYKSKSRYRRHTGHRQVATVLEVEGGVKKAESKAVETEKVAVQAKAEVVKSETKTASAAKSVKKVAAAKTVKAEKKPTTKKSTTK